MNYKFTSLKKISDLLETEGSLSAGEIAEKLGFSRTIVHKYLKALVERGQVTKNGKSPHTKYVLTSHLEKEVGTMNIPILGHVIDNPIDFETRSIVNENFFKFTPDGEILRGFHGLQKWCINRKLSFISTLEEYVKIQKYVASLYDNCGMLGASSSFGKYFEINYLDTVYFSDQYIYAQFGRGKLAELAFYGKQSQNKKLISEAIGEFFPKLECLIARDSFDAIAIAPWSVKRENQILGILKKKLGTFSLPFVNVIKYSSSGIFIPQKSLKKTQDRIENAKNTIFIDDKNIGNYKKILLIDDFVGSGATLNETAKKLKYEGVKHVTGFAFVGNTDLSYEVINEI